MVGQAQCAWRAFALSISDCAILTRVHLEYFLLQQDWIRGGHDDSGPTGRDGARGEGQKGGSSAAQEAALRASFAAAFVVAPTDPEKAAHPCPICKEPFKSEWSEEEEEWLWRNAQEVDGTVSCARARARVCVWAAGSKQADRTACL